MMTDAYPRGESACSLGHIGDARAVEPLIAALEDEEDLTARNKAVEALGRIGDRRAVEALITALENWSWSGRKEAAEALGRIGDPRAGDTLVAALTDRDRKVREAAAQALDGLSWSPDRSEAAAAYWVTRGNWDNCVEIGASAVSPLVTAMGLSYDEATRHAAAGAIAQIADAGAMKALMADIRDITTFNPVEETNTSWNLHDGKTSPYRLAASALIQIGPPAVPPLVAALADDDPSVCQRAVDTLARIGTPAVEPLVAALENPNKRVSEAAASVLRQLDALPSQWLNAPSPLAGQAEPALGTGADEPVYLRGEGAGASQPTATAGSAVHAQGDTLTETCGMCASQIDHFGFTQDDAVQVLAWRGQPGGNERRQALMRSVGGTCPGCAGVCCSKCYYDKEFTCPRCQSKIPELGGPAAGSPASATQQEG